MSVWLLGGRETKEGKGGKISSEVVHKESTGSRRPSMRERERTTPSDRRDERKAGRREKVGEKTKNSRFTQNYCLRKKKGVSRTDRGASLTIV